MPATPEHHSFKSVWLGGAALAVLVIAILVGVQLAHSNSDYVCSSAVNDSQQGACTGGGWGPWTNTSGGLQRTYTGVQGTVSFAGRVIVSCSHPAPSAAGATGQITTQYAACQIVETGSYATGNGNNSNSGDATSSITSTGQTVTTGAVSTSTVSSGSYTDYQNTVEAQLATSTISVVPSLLHAGATTQVTWTSSHVRSCTVLGTNGDSWPQPVQSSEVVTDADGNQQTVQTTTTPAGLTGSETSSPINGQTIYTLTCVTALGTQLVTQTEVNIIPSFQEL